jgi:hypothetical protein
MFGDSSMIFSSGKHTVHIKDIQSNYESMSQVSKLYSEKSMFRTVVKFVHNTEEVRRV